MSTLSFLSLPLAILTPTRLPSPSLSFSPPFDADDTPFASVRRRRYTVHIRAGVSSSKRAVIRIILLLWLQNLIQTFWIWNLISYWISLKLPKVFHEF
ncbi:hypothetical protein L1987_11958 [Smallanthus sonchifolius]|uniref:Uncharacterized protein n=1 Tax=Smallanthus sonchifolius TaxID=185202 RepID=A0ACB9JEJ1_9ASTR|nr:hypothetical protein L1987_11958 [Smallanthus sonchifolius]